MEGTSVFDDIRDQCRWVAEQSRHVHIIVEHIPVTITPLLAESPVIPALDTNSHFVGETEDTIGFFMTLAAVNFGSGYFPHLHKRSGMSGYYTIATALTERFASNGPFTAQQLAGISASDCAALFQQDTQNAAMAELMDRFATSWNDLGEDLVSRFNGSFTRCIEAADHQASHLVSLLSEQPLFRDVSLYHGAEVPFYKRSQLLASDLSLALREHGLGQFDDLDELTIFADNLVPHVLRVEGILEYTPKLIADIEAERLIPEGSDEEIEIRACSVHAVELIIEAAANAGYRWTARDVDQMLWHQGQNPRYKAQSKRHRTRTVFY
ncbi:queuosine salvage family protein [Candidatus Bipolaricaulota bacterium]|nr:queuosine salvage family protein [Candidatus Bipolaricaulota bacterium]